MTRAPHLLRWQSFPSSGHPIRTRAISTPVKTIDDGPPTLIADMFEQMDDAPRNLAPLIWP